MTHSVACASGYAGGNRMTSHEQLLHDDAANRERALALESFIVEAPAGAGKTELLTQRYLRLLQTVREPEEIVAITFTNKAAAEMRVRILESLKVAAGGVTPAQPHKRITYELATVALATSARLGWNLLEQPGRLRINTIDSLSSHLARQMPLLSRFGTQPAVSQDATQHYDEAVRRTLGLLEETGPAAAVVAAALQHLDNDVGRLSRLLMSMLARRDQWLHHTHRQGAQEEAEEALRQLVANDLAIAASVLNGRVQSHLMPVARYAASNLARDHAIALLIDWETPLSPHPESLPMWRGIGDLLLTATDGALRKAFNKNMGLPATDEAKPYKEALNEVIDSLRATPGAEAAIARIRRLPLARHGDAEWQIVGTFAQLLNLAAAQLWMVFQQAGEVDFVEISRRALEALQDTSGAPTDLALKLDYQIQHLLVDEFQDTSPAQVDLLRCLTLGWTPDDERTLFCVGDPMQSIYRFRKAEVGLFLRVAEQGIDHVSLTKLRLCRNNRSCPEVVEWVNRSFAGVFPLQDSVMQGAIRYRDFVATRDSLPQAGVQVHALVLPKEAAAEAVHALEAKRIVEIIRRERAQDPDRKIAVLVSARSHLQALVAEIRRHQHHDHAHHADLRFQAVEIEALAGRQIVQDLLALTHALHHRADRVHWLAILRAPWCGLKLADLHVLAADDHRATVWALINDDARFQRLSEDGRLRLLHVRNILGEALARRGRQPTRRWIEGVWLQLGGASCLWEAGDVRDVQAYLDLIERLESGGQFSTELLATEVEKLYAAPDSQASDTLQFMTIHKSKGLEFDTVILPGLHRAGASDDKQLLLWEEVAMEGVETQLVAAPLMPKSDGGPTAYDYLRLLELERSDNEGARVLYVGVTRAIRSLHLVGVARPDKDGNPKPPANTPLALLWDAVGASFAQAPVENVDADIMDIRQFVPPLVRLAQPAVAEQLCHISATVDAVFDEQAEPEQAGTRLDADVGTLAHRYVEIIAQGDPNQWDTSRIKTLQPAMQRWLIQQGHDETEARRGASRVVSVLSTTLVSDQGRWVLQAREQAAAELTLATVEAGHIATHIVDRTFIENGERWVVDYKSARLGEVSEASLEQQAVQYRPQLERYAKLFVHEGLPVRKAVFFLAHGRMVELV